MSSNQQLAKKSQVPVARSQKPEARHQNPDASGQRPDAESRPFIVPVFLPHAGCPHQCAYCNQSSITGTHAMPASKDVHRQIKNFLGYRRQQPQNIQIAFFGGNFLGIQTQTLQRLLADATEYVTAGHVSSIRFSTRPDTVNGQQLDLIKKFPVSTIELGVQSMNNSVLKCSNRGHTAEDSINAAQLLKNNEYEVGVQLMVGLPGDSAQRLGASAQAVARLKPDFVRIYPTVVLSGSPLAAWYQKGDYVPLSLAEAVSQVKDLYLLFKRQKIRVIRMGLQASEDLQNAPTILAGPYHPAFGHLVYSEIFLDMAIAAIKSENLSGEVLCLHVHPHSVSKMRGLKNGNIKQLCQKFDLQTVDIVTDDSLRKHQLKISARP